MALMDSKEREDKEAVEIIDAKPLNAKTSGVLYQARKKIHPMRATGTFRRLKWWIMGITLAIYYLTPWLRWDRGPVAPDQAVLVDLANRRFYFFFVEIWPHEFFFVAGMLVMAGIGLFLVTSVLGRAWCGYTCPQTVWVDLFLVVERFFEGDRNARIKLDEAQWSGSKLFKRISKHSVWMLIAVSTGGAWIFYFADAPTLFIDLFTGQAAYVAYATVAVMTATTYIFGGLMREQVCTYMCPWPRIQAAMLDEHSLTVTYNDWRGEPRDRHAKRLRKDGQLVGDCVDCNACVAVCPMGIDIREGQQLECITCALCIDACDHVMDKIGLERGLISYATLDAYDANMALAGARPDDDHNSDRLHVPADAPSKIRQGGDGQLATDVRHTGPRSMLRGRTFLYAAIYGAIGLALLFALTVRSRLELRVSHDRNPVFVQLSDGSIRNGYELKILNMRGQDRRFILEIVGFPEARMRLAGSDLNQDASAEITVEADKLRAQRVFVTVPRDGLKSQQTDFQFRILDIAGEDQSTVGTSFDAPKR